MSDVVNNSKAEPTSNAQGSSPSANSTAPAKPEAASNDAAKVNAGDVVAAKEGGQPEAVKSSEQKPVAPAKYDLKMPDGALLDAARIEKITAFAKEKGLSNDDAQKLLDSENAAVSAYADGQKKLVEETKSKWVDTVKNDKEIGGEAFGKSAEYAKRVVEKYGSEDFKKTLNETGLGNHPELVRVFARIGKAMSEDRLVQPGTLNGNNRSLEEKLYGSSDKEN